MDVEATVFEIVRDILDCKEPTLNTHLRNDLGADSLDMVELMIELEDEFQFTMPDCHADKIQTVGDIVAYVKDKVRNPAEVTAE